MKYKLKELLFLKRKEPDKLARYFYQPVSNFFLWIFLNLKISANAVSWIMALVSVVAGLFYLSGEKSLLIAGSLLFTFAMILDHTDGDVARATKKFSTKGEYLDQIHHSCEELFTFVGLGIYLTRSTQNPNYFVMGVIASTLLVYTNYLRAKMFWFTNRGYHYDLRYRTWPLVFLYGNLFKVWHFFVLFAVLFDVVDILLYIALIWTIVSFVPRLYVHWKDVELYDEEKKNRG